MTGPWGDILTPEEIADMERIDQHAAECGEDCTHTMSEVLGRPFPDPSPEPTGGTMTLNVGPHRKTLPYNATGKQISDTITELTRLAQADHPEPKD